MMIRQRSAKKTLRTNQLDRAVTIKLWGFGLRIDSGPSPRDQLDDVLCLYYSCMGLAVFCGMD